MSGNARCLWHLSEANLSKQVAGELDARAASHWDTFYQQNKTKFFKDRHYLHREFPELATGDCTILEVGCGVGNTAYPLLELNQSSYVHACDFSPSAVAMVKAHPQYSSGRMHAFVADITSDDLRAEVSANSVDFCTMVFVLSAITPAKMPAAVANVARVLRSCKGRVLVRDYAEGDLAQLRLSGPTRNQRLSHNFYVRSDGTQAYYFSKATLLRLFKDAGFWCLDYKVQERQIENRLREVTMQRRWVQAVFCHAPDQATAPTISDKSTDSSQAHACNVPLAILATDPQASTHMQKTDQDQHSSSQTGFFSQPEQQAGQQNQQGTPAGNCSSPNQQSESNPKPLHAKQYQVSPDAPDVTPEAQQSVETDCMPSPNGSLSSSMEHQGERATSDAVRQQEWEDGGTTPEEELLTGCLFAEAGLEEVTEDVEIEQGGLVAQIVSVSRQHRHTLEHTGLMRWESCLPLARFLLAVPSLTQGRQVLELGSGVNPLCCLAVLRHCRRYVATDGSVEALKGLARNLDLNCRNVVIERARISVLAWGNAKQQAVVKKQCLSFDTILGADVVYAAEALSSLFETCNALLSPCASARLVLCHVARRVSEEAIVEAAAASGLYLQQNTQDITDGAGTAFAGEPFRLLMFCKV